MFILCQGSAVLFGLETLDCPEFPLHRSEKAMLLLALNGMPQILENGQLHQARPGDLLLLSPGAFRALCGGGRVLLIFFDPCMTGICASDLRTLLPRSPLFPAEIVPQDVRALLPLLPAVREERALRGYLQAICARLLSATETVSRPAWEELDWPERATDYLSAHFTDPVSLGVLADAVGMSKYHLSRSFPERIGYLCHTFHNIACISRCGFGVSDYTGFPRLRIDILRLSPLAVGLSEIIKIFSVFERN